MPEPGKSDKWNSLLETLGVPATEPPAKPPEAAAEPPKAASAPPARMGKPAAKPKATPPAAKSPSYWSRIAGALGLETPAVPEPEPVPPTPAPPAPVAERPARSQESGGRGREAQPDRNAPPPRKLESMFGPKEPDVDVFALDEGSDRSAEEPPRQPMHREPPASRREPPASRREPPPSRREPPPSRREPPAGRSEAPAGRGEPPPSRREPPPGREAPPPVFSAEDDEGFVLDYEVEGDSDLNLGEEPVAPVTEASDEGSDRGGPPRGERRDSPGGLRGDSAGPRDSEDGPREGGRRRRGRRRGRGRGGRREDGPPPPGAPASPPRFADQDDDLEEYGPPAEAEFEREPEFDLDEGSDLDLGPALPPAARGNEADDRLPPRRPQRSESAGPRSESSGGPRDDDGGRSRRGRRGGRGRGRDRDRDRPPAGPRPADYGPGPRNERLEDDLPLDEEAADIELAGEPEEDEGPASGHPTHKKIPTWEEAVGILVEANMAARADRPDRDRGRGSGGGGGRGRGGGGRGRGGGGGGGRR